jgi:hypothetical protein
MKPEEKKWVENLINDPSPNEMKMVRLVCIIEKQERMLDHIKKVLRHGEIVSKIDYVYVLFRELEEMER